MEAASTNATKLQRGLTARLARPGCVPEASLAANCGTDGLAIGSGVLKVMLTGNMAALSREADFSLPPGPCEPEGLS